jgi:hypothetical protein
VRQRWWCTGAIAGSGIIAFGIFGALSHAGATEPVQLATWTIGAALFHDALLAPAVIGVGFVTARWVPAPLRVPVRIGLALSAVVTALAWPYIRRYGYRASNPSALPFHYGRNLVFVLVII